MFWSNVTENGPTRAQKQLDVSNFWDPGCIEIILGVYEILVVMNIAIKALQCIML